MPIEGQPTIPGHWDWKKAADIPGERDIALMLICELWNLQRVDIEEILYNMYPILRRCNYSWRQLYDRYKCRFDKHKNLRIHKRIDRPNDEDGANGKRPYTPEELAEFAAVLNCILSWMRHLRIDTTYKTGHKANLLGGTARPNMITDALRPGQAFKASLIAALHAVPNGVHVPGLPPRNVSVTNNGTNLAASSGSNSNNGTSSNNISTNNTFINSTSASNTPTSTTSTNNTSASHTSVSQTMENLGARLTARRAGGTTTAPHVTSRPTPVLFGTSSTTKAVQYRGSRFTDGSSREESESDSEGDIAVLGASRKRDIREVSPDNGVEEEPATKKRPTSPLDLSDNNEGDSSVPKLRSQTNIRRRKVASGRLDAQVEAQAILDSVGYAQDYANRGMDTHLYIHPSPAWPAESGVTTTPNLSSSQPVFQHGTLTLANFDQYSAQLIPDYVEIKAQQLNQEEDAANTAMRTSHSIFSALASAREMPTTNSSRQPTPIWRPGYPTAAERYSLGLDALYGVASGHGSATSQRRDSVEPEWRSGGRADSLTGLPLGVTAANEGYDADLLPSDGLEEKLGFEELFGGDN